jgi:hypothetical protein
MFMAFQGCLALGSFTGSVDDGCPWCLKLQHVATHVGLRPWWVICVGIRARGASSGASILNNHHYNFEK